MTSIAHARRSGEDVRDRIREAIQAGGLDAVVCLSPENVAYSAGFVVPSQSLMRWRHAATVLCSTGPQAMLCVDMELSTVRARWPLADLRAWSEFGGNAMSTLAELLEDLGVGRGRIGLELSYLPVSDHRQLRGHLPRAELVAADGLLMGVRRTKTEDELSLLRRLAVVSDTAIQTAFTAARGGCTEMDLAASLTRSVYEQGAEQFKLMIVATGERSQLPNVGPTTRRLERGDVCRVEIFSVLDGYQAGVCRTAVVGDPSADAERIYENLAECRRRVLEAIRPGASTRSVYETYIEKFSELKLDAIPFVGHGIGVDLHEPPYLGPDSDDVIREGMVFGIEPLVYRTGHGFGMQIKDMVAVTATGSRLLSDVSDPDRLFRIEA